jgi:hypothetical protein
MAYLGPDHLIEIGEDAIHMNLCYHINIVLVSWDRDIYPWLSTHLLQNLGLFYCVGPHYEHAPRLQRLEKGCKGVSNWLVITFPVDGQTSFIGA